MKLYLKQKVISIKDRFTVYDEFNSVKYTCSEKLISIVKKYRLYDTNNTEKVFIKQKLISWLPKFYVYINGEKIATVKKCFSIRPKYFVPELNWKIKGNILEHQYSIMQDDKEIASVSKKYISWGDSYEINIIDAANEIKVLSIVLIIDMVDHSNRR